MKTAITRKEFKEMVEELLSIAGYVNECHDNDCSQEEIMQAEMKLELFEKEFEEKCGFNPQHPALDMLYLAPNDVAFAKLHANIVANIHN